jgi:hypothetical protein
VQMMTILASEGLFTVLIVGALAVWMSERPNIWARAALTGLLLAGACYVKPTALLVPFILAFVHLVRHKDFLRTVGAGAIMFAVMGVLIAPWTLRNHRVFGEFVLISTNGGANMWMGNNPASTGEYTPLPPETEYMNEAERNTYLRAEARAFIRENPGIFVQRFFTRLIDTHSRESISVVWNEPGLESRYGEGVAMPLKVLNLGFWLGMLLLALAGIGVSFIRFGWWATLTHPAVLFWGYYAGVHAVIVAQDRYHYPSIPMIAALAGLAAWTVTARVFGRADDAAEPQA